MLEILQNLIATFTGDATLTAIVPASQIFVGQVDIVEQTQAGLQLPQINIHVISENTLPVPTNARDTLIQIDIFSRNDMLEVVEVYERILVLVNYFIGNYGAAHLFWQLSSGMVDQYESGRTLFHRSITFKVWAIKPH
jgi:hypothetical protein